MAKTLTDLFHDQLRDVYNAEGQLIKALPKMAKAATSEQLRTAFQEHLEQTEKQVERLEEVFRQFGHKLADGLAGLGHELQHVGHADEAVAPRDDAGVDDTAVALAADRAVFAEHRLHDVGLTDRRAVDRQ